MVTRIMWYMIIVYALSFASSTIILSLYLLSTHTHYSCSVLNHHQNNNNNNYNSNNWLPHSLRCSIFRQSKIFRNIAQITEWTMLLRAGKRLLSSRVVMQNENYYHTRSQTSSLALHHCVLNLVVRFRFIRSTRLKDFCDKQWCAHGLIIDSLPICSPKKKLL